MAPSKNQYDSIEEESQALIVEKSDNGESSHQSKFRPSFILGFLGVVALYCMVVASNNASEVSGVRGDMALVMSKYESLANTVSTSARSAGQSCSQNEQCGDNGTDMFCYAFECRVKYDAGGPCLNASFCKSNACGPDRSCVGGDDVTQCSKKSDQSDYRGTIHRTASGKPCQTWSGQSPHRHGNTPQARPGAGLETKVGLFDNTCRNPDGESRAWCYTTDPRTRWEYCDVPRC